MTVIYIDMEEVLLDSPLGNPDKPLSYYYSVEQ
jgi:hypothetical protein